MVNKSAKGSRMGFTDTNHNVDCDIKKKTLIFTFLHKVDDST